MSYPTIKPFCREMSFFDDLLDASHLSALKADFDAVRVVRGFGKDVFYDAPGEFSGALVLFQNDKHGHAGFKAGAFLSVREVHGVMGMGVSVGVGVGVGVSVGKGVRDGVGVAGMGVSVGAAVGGTRVGVRLGVRVGSGVGVGRLNVRKTRFSAWKSSPFMR
jgi:hypothetical protein